MKHPKFIALILACGAALSLRAGNESLTASYEPRPVEGYFQFGGPETRFEPVSYRDITGRYPDADVPGLKTISYEAFPSDCDKKQEVFAYLGIPDGPVPAGGFPAVVFGHGGWGWAGPGVVDSLKKHGYVAISMSCEGCAYVKDGKHVKLKEFPGFPGYGNYRYHPQLYVRANSLLRGLPMVNKDKIAYLGQSWGAVKGSILSCVDPRFKCMVLLSGNGYWRIGDDSLNMFKDYKQIENLDPAWYLSAAKVPIYWQSGTNDQFFGAAAWQKSVEAAPTTENQLMLYELPHARMGRTCDRVLAAELKGEVPVPKLGPSAVKDNVVSADILEPGKGIKSAVLCYTTDKTPFRNRKWKIAPAAIRDKTVSAKIPVGAVQYFLAVFDETGDFNKIGREGGDYQKFCGGSSTIFTIE